MASVLASAHWRDDFSYFSRGHARVSVAAGQKVVPSPAVSSAMCRMWVIFKEAQVLAFQHEAPATAMVGWAAASCWRVTRDAQARKKEDEKFADYIYILIIQGFISHLDSSGAALHFKKPLYLQTLEFLSSQRDYSIRNNRFLGCKVGGTPKAASSQVSIVYQLPVEACTCHCLLATRSVFSVI